MTETEMLNNLSEVIQPSQIKYLFPGTWMTDNQGLLWPHQDWWPVTWTLKGAKYVGPADDLLSEHFFCCLLCTWEPCWTIYVYLNLTSRELYERNITNIVLQMRNWGFERTVNYPSPVANEPRQSVMQLIWSLVGIYGLTPVPAMVPVKWESTEAELKTQN